MKKMYLRWNDNILSFIRENTPGFSKYLGVHGTLENNAQLRKNPRYAPLPVLQFWLLISAVYFNLGQEFLFSISFAVLSFKVSLHFHTLQV